MKLTLTFEIDEVLGAENLDDLSDRIRDAIDEKIGETDYMVQDAYINIELDE